MRRPRLLVLLLLVAALLGGGVAAVRGLFLHDTVRAASVANAIRGFRATGLTAKGVAGVYVYSTRGTESIDALGGARHSYPPTTSITAVAVPCGVRLDWRALEGRSTSWTLCATPAGIEVKRYVEVHRFFGSTDRTAYECAGTVLLPSARSARASRPYRCRTSGATQVGTVLAVGRGNVGADGTRRAAIHVRTTAHVLGASHGTETVDWWLDARDALPLRIVLESRTSRKVIVLEVHYREDAVIDRVSATPRR